MNKSGKVIPSLRRPGGAMKLAFPCIGENRE